MQQYLLVNSEIVWVGDKFKINIMWNIITIIICAVALFFNLYLWYIYRSKTVKEVREKEGWDSFHLISTFLIIIVLLTRIGKI